MNSLKKIFDGKIYEVLPKSDGIVFPYQKAIVDEGDIVWYKMLSLENSNLSDIGKNVYWNLKFGSNYAIAVNTINNFVSTKSLLLPDGKLLLCCDNGQVFIIDPDGLINIAGELKYRELPPTDIAFYKNGLWASFENNNVLIRFNINTMRAELRIGGKNSPFDKPQGVFIEGQTAYVCNAGSQNIVKVDLENYSVDELYSFEEPVQSYVKSGKFEFVLLESGLYII